VMRANSSNDVGRHSAGGRSAPQVPRAIRPPGGAGQADGVRGGCPTYDSQKENLTPQKSEYAQYSPFVYILATAASADVSRSRTVRIQGAPTRLPDLQPDSRKTHRVPRAPRDTRCAGPFRSTGRGPARAACDTATYTGRLGMLCIAAANRSSVTSSSTIVPPRKSA
jgi:hypothetical protein